MTALRDAARLLAQLAGATLAALWCRFATDIATCGDRGCDDCANAADERSTERHTDLCSTDYCDALAHGRACVKERP